MSSFTLEFDGGSRGNPGPSGIGVVVRAPDNTPLVTLGRFIGRATNNVAEYRALIAGLEQALKLNAKKLLVRGDSELIIRQMTGVYRVKNADLRELFEEAQSLVAQFDQVKFQHNMRHHNELADKLANLAMDRKSDVTDADDAPASASAEAETPSPHAAGDRIACPRCGCVVQLVAPSRLYPHQLKPFVCQCGAKMG